MSALQDFQKLFDQYQKRIEQEISPDLKEEVQNERRRSIDSEYKPQLEAGARAVRADVAELQQRRKQLSDPVRNLLVQAMGTNRTPEQELLSREPTHRDVVRSINDSILAAALSGMDISGLESMAGLVGNRPALALAVRSQLTARPDSEYGSEPRQQLERKTAALASIDGAVKMDKGGIVATLLEEREALRTIQAFEEVTNSPNPTRKLTWAHEDAALERQIKALGA